MNSILTGGTIACHVSLASVSPILAEGRCSPETNITPENGWLEDYLSFWDDLFSGAFAMN